ncbi:cytochrome P450 2C38-like [Glandiceps talaboti]
MAAILLATTILLIAFLISRWRRPNLPPGPTGWPILGSLPFLAGKQMDITLTELGRKYGDVYSIMFGSYLVVVLNSYDVIKEALVKRADYFNGRPTNTKRMFRLDRGVLRAYNASWKEHRRFILSSLRDIGMGPRMCLGLQMAKMELFLFFTTLMQHYTFKLPNGTPPLTTERVNGLICSPKPYNVCILKR